MSLEVQIISVKFLKRQTIFRGLGAAKTNVQILNPDTGFSPLVWKREWQDPVNPKEGAIPLALEVNNRGDADHMLNVELSADFVFPGDWIQPNKGGTFFKLQLSTPAGIKLETIPTLINVLNPGKVMIKGLKLLEPMNGSIKGPFRADGPWTAKITCCNMAGQEAPDVAIKSVTDLKTIPLEIYFFIGGLHGLFALGHRIEILRRSVMDIMKYLKITDGLDYRAAAVAHVANDCWKNFPNLRYDTYLGRSTCGMRGKGGTLNLEAVFRTNTGRINCYDLAAINQAWCASLGRINGGPGNYDQPVLETFWCFSGTWFGYITEGPLFGWTRPTLSESHRRCNSPLWEFRDSKQVNYPAAIKATDQDRTWFDTHAWTEVKIQLGDYQPRVLETCHGYLEGGDINQVRVNQAEATRQEWIGATVEEGFLTAQYSQQYEPLSIDRNGRGTTVMHDGTVKTDPMKSGEGGLEEIWG